MSAKEEEKKIFQCDIPGCSKLFSCKKTLKEHERTHTGERPYICPICQGTFAQYSSMQKHQRVHDKMKPYSCKFEGCHQSFTQISNLIRHERIHTGEKPYICELCNKQFASGSNLKQHMQVHNSEERFQYKCFVENCDKAYLYLSSLKKHIVLTHPLEHELKVRTRKVDLAQECKRLVRIGTRQPTDFEDEEEHPSSAECEEENLSSYDSSKKREEQSHTSISNPHKLEASNNYEEYGLSQRSYKEELPINTSTDLKDIQHHDANLETLEEKILRKRSYKQSQSNSEDDSHDSSKSFSKKRSNLDRFYTTDIDGNKIGASASVKKEELFDNQALDPTCQKRRRTSTNNKGLEENKETDFQNQKASTEPLASEKLKSMASCLTMATNDSTNMNQDFSEYVNRHTPIKQLSSNFLLPQPFELMRVSPSSYFVNISSSDTPIAANIGLAKHLNSAFPRFNSESESNAEQQQTINTVILPNSFQASSGVLGGHVIYNTDGPSTGLLASMKSLYQELQVEASGPIFEKIQQYAALAATTALAFQKQQIDQEVKKKKCSSSSLGSFSEDTLNVQLPQLDFEFKESCLETPHNGAGQQISNSSTLELVNFENKSMSKNEEASDLSGNFVSASEENPFLQASQSQLLNREQDINKNWDQGSMITMEFNQLKSDSDMPSGIQISVVQLDSNKDADIQQEELVMMKFMKDEGQQTPNKLHLFSKCGSFKAYTKKQGSSFSAGCCLLDQQGYNYQTKSKFCCNTTEDSLSQTQTPEQEKQALQMTQSFQKEEEISPANIWKTSHQTYFCRQTPLPNPDVSMNENAEKYPQKRHDSSSFFNYEPITPSDLISSTNLLQQLNSKCNTFTSQDGRLIDNGQLDQHIHHDQSLESRFISQTSLTQNNCQSQWENTPTQRQKGSNMAFSKRKISDIILSGGNQNQDNSYLESHNQNHENLTKIAINQNTERLSDPENLNFEQSLERLLYQKENNKINQSKEPINHCQAQGSYSGSSIFPPVSTDKYEQFFSKMPTNKDGLSQLDDIQNKQGRAEGLIGLMNNQSAKQKRNFFMMNYGKVSSNDSIKGSMSFLANHCNSTQCKCSAAFQECFAEREVQMAEIEELCKVTQGFGISESISSNACFQ